MFAQLPLQRQSFDPSQTTFGLWRISDKNVISSCPALKRHLQASPTCLWDMNKDEAPFERNDHAERRAMTAPAPAINTIPNKAKGVTTCPQMTKAQKLAKTSSEYSKIAT